MQASLDEIQCPWRHMQEKKKAEKATSHFSCLLVSYMPLALTAAALPNRCRTGCAGGRGLVEQLISAAAIALNLGESFKRQQRRRKAVSAKPPRATDH